MRARMSPGQVIDQLIDYAREGPAAEFGPNLAREVRENPLPLVLIGIGIAWLMAASSRSSAPDCQRRGFRNAESGGDQHGNQENGAYYGDEQKGSPDRVVAGRTCNGGVNRPRQ